MPSTARLVLLALLVVVMMPPSMAAAAPRSIAPVHSHPHGRTYGEWAAAWWQWALGAPTGVNPVLDTTGVHCAEGQTGRVWFLAGTFGNATVERQCAVPTGTALFFPLINAFYGAFLNDPPAERTEAFLRAQVACVDVEIEITVNGIAIRNPLQYSVQSPLFDVQLPADNVFGVGEDVIPELLLSPSVDAGYYLFVRPLPPGTYIIHWTASQSCPFGHFTQEVTYELTVQ